MATPLRSILSCSAKSPDLLCYCVPITTAVNRFIFVSVCSVVMQINKSITSINVKDNSIGSAGQSTLFAAATQKLVEARRNESPAPFFLATDAPTDFRTAKLRTSYLEMAKKPFPEKNYCTLVRDLFCCSKTAEKKKKDRRRCRCNRRAAVQRRPSLRRRCARLRTLGGHVAVADFDCSIGYSGVAEEVHVRPF